MRFSTSTLRYAIAGAICLSAAVTADAQDLLAEKPIHTLGEAKTWSNGDASYTFVTDDLVKLVAVPTNTANVYLYPENGAINNEENQAKGAQGFYIDMEASHEIAVVSSTWEGAAADEYKIYLTDEVPTLSILDTTPTYEATGLGQYTSNTAILPEGSKGRYLVFQVTKATNWGWGVKMRSISAVAPAEDELTSFGVAPAFAQLGQPVELEFTYKNQNNLDIDASKITLTVTDNATLEGNTLTINSGESAALTATLDGNSLEAVVYVVSAPAVPEIGRIKTPVFTNGLTDNNGDVEWTLAYNGGADNYGMMTFDNGEVAQMFGNARCIFFSNKTTTGAWNADIDPTTLGYRSLHLDIFATESATGNVVFERTTTIGDNHPFTLEAGKWNSIDVVLTGETVMYTMSVRFDAENACDIVLANIYFTPAFVEGDETAPVLGDVTATAAMTSVELTMSATDDLSDNVYYTITSGEKSWKTEGKSGEAVTYTVTGLDASTDYTFSVTANDGKNTSEAKTVEVTTLGYPASPKSDKPAANVSAIFSTNAEYKADVLPKFDAWGSTAVMSTITIEGQEIPYFSNYNGQWGGLVDFEVPAMNATHLHIDILGFGTEGTLTLAPVWKGYENTPNKTVTIEANKWNSFDISLADFGVTLPTSARADEIKEPTANQFSMTGSTIPDFAIDNLYFYADGPLSGIETIGNDATAADTTVYNLQGIRLGNSLENLPAGLYIVGGKKIMKR